MIESEVTPVPAPVEVKESLGIKETLEIIAGLGVVVPCGVEVAADGKLSSKDIKPVVEAIKKYDVVVAAVKDGGDAIKESKDYDMIELAQIGKAFLDQVIVPTKAAYAAGKA